MSMFKIFLSHGEREHLVQSIRDVALPTPSFYALLLLSAAIASFGLLSNSTATVIGAMVVAPLMGPIFGITLGLVMGDHRILTQALIAEITGIAIVIVLGLLIGEIPLLPEYGSEILGRTQPTVLDLVAALASGAAGAYCWVNPKVSNAIAGVAIAVALVPPLSACGLLVAASEERLAWGSFLLFMANFVAIQFAAAVVFLLAGLRHHDPFADKRSRSMQLANALGPGLVGVLILAAILTRTLMHVIEDRRLETDIRGHLVEELSGLDGAALDQMQFRRMPDKSLEIVASVLTPRPFEPSQVDGIEDELGLVCGCSVRLIVRSLISSDVDGNGRVYLSDEEQRSDEERREQRRLQDRASAILSAELGEVKGAYLAGIELGDENGALAVKANVETPVLVQPLHVGFIQARLSEELKRPVRLRINSILTHIADSQRFIYEADPEAGRLSPEERIMEVKATSVLRAALAAQLPGSTLNTCVLEPGMPGTLAAGVRAPRVLTAEDVAALQEKLAAELGEELTLEVETSVGGSAMVLGKAPAPAEPAGASQ